MSIGSMAWRLFVTSWIVYAVHFATDFSREHFLVMSMVENHTFRLDPYADMHNDIFVLPNGHAHHGANPGISMIGAVPYFFAAPLVDRVVAAELAHRSNETHPVYRDPRLARRLFYTLARERGLDVRFGLVGMVTEFFAMAPLAAFGVVVVFLLLEGAGLRPRLALAGAILYGFGTPVFFRAAYLNHNLAVGIFAITGLWLLWNPGDRLRWSDGRRAVLAGLCGGVAFLCDYSGALVLGALGIYGLLRVWEGRPGMREIGRLSVRFALGAAGPILLLWYYQWASFGNPFLPPQNYMAPVPWSDLGYQGVTGPQAELWWMLLLDARFGLLITCPILILAVFGPWLAWTKRSPIPMRETVFCLAFSIAFIVFFSSVQYTRLQYIHGIRYVVPVIPFLLLPTIAMLLQLPRIVSIALGLGSLALGWGMAMARLQELQGSVFDGFLDLLVGGPQLPALLTFEKMAAQYDPGLAHVSPTTIFLLAGVAIAVIWTVRRPWTPFTADR